MGLKPYQEEKQDQIRRTQLNELVNQQLEIDEQSEEDFETNLETLKIREHEKDLLSTTFLKHYRVQELLKCGAEGVVYRVHCVRPLVDREKNYAMKMLLHYDPNVGSLISTLNQQLRNEYTILRQLPYHPHIITLYHQFCDELDPMCLPNLPPMAQLQTKSLFLIYEYHQKTLQDVVDEFRTSGKIFPETQLIWILSQILRGLLFLEKNSVVHRDLKLNNILVKGDMERIILIDFGLAIYLPEKPKMTLDFEGYGQFLWGNPQHLPPEIAYFTEKQAKLESPVSKFFQISEKVNYTRSDLWSVGYIMYELAGIEIPSTSQNSIPQIPLYSEKLNTIFRSMMHPDPFLRPNIHKVLMSLNFCHKIQLRGGILQDIDEFEYREIRKKVEEIFPQYRKQLVVEDIKKVFNPKLEILAKKYRKEMFKPTVVSLFHGTSESSLEEIIAKGFKIPTTAYQPVVKVELHKNQEPKITYKPCGEEFLNNILNTTNQLHSIFQKTENDTEYVVKRDLLFGCGIYFSSSSTKCSAYSEYGNSNKLLLCDVAIGKHKKLTETDPTLDYFSLKHQGYDSVYCPGGDSSIVKVEEFVVYHPLQPLPRYVIKFRSMKITTEETKRMDNKFLESIPSRGIPTLLQLCVRVLKQQNWNEVFEKTENFFPDFLPTVNYFLEQESMDNEYEKIWKTISTTLFSKSSEDVVVSLVFLGNFLRDNYYKGNAVPPMELLSQAIHLLKSPNETIVWHALRVLWNACFLNIDVQKKVFQITPKIVIFLEDLIFSPNRSICERAAGLVWNLTHQDQEICFQVMKSQLLPSFMEIISQYQETSDQKKNNFIQNCLGATANVAFHFPEEVKTVVNSVKGLPIVLDWLFDNQHYTFLVTRLWCNMISKGKIEANWEEEGYNPLTNAIQCKKEKKNFPKDTRLSKEHPPLRWVLDEERTQCKGCNIDFGFFVRKHHCRGCGEIFCGKCVGGCSEIRLCDSCVKSWEKGEK